MNCRWDIDVAVDCCSEQVEIVFSALHSTISEIGVKASAWQARNVTSHIIDIVRCNLYLTHHMILTWSDKCHLYKHYESSCCPYRIGIFIFLKIALGLIHSETL